MRMIIQLNGRSMFTFIFTSYLFYSHAHPFSKSHHSTIVRDSTSRVVESTDNLTLFANDQGSEIPDSAQFYEIWRTFFLTENNTVNSTNYDTATATFVPSVVGNNSTWNDDTTLYNMSDKTFVLDDRRNVSEKVTIS